MSLEGVLKTKLLQQECHFTWSLREEDFVVSDLLNRLEEQIQLESDKVRVTRAYSSFGFVQYLNGNHQEALANLQKSVQLAKEKTQDSDEVLIVPYGDLAWLHYHMKDFSTCQEYLRQLDRIHGKVSEGSTFTIEVLREKGWAFLKFSHKYSNAAKQCFRQALEMNPDDSDLNTGYAIALYRTTSETSDSSDSPTIKQLEKAIKLNPDDAVLLVLLALRMLHYRDDIKMRETALKMVNVALLMSAENPHVIRYAAKFCRKLGNMDSAICLLKQALLETPNSAFIHHQLAICYKSQKNSLEEKYRVPGKTKHFGVEESYEIKQYLEMCIYHLDKAISLKPNFIIAMADLALHYGQLGNIKAEHKAEGLFEEAFKWANNEKQHLPTVHCFYGQYQLYTKRSEQLAIYHFMQGLRLQPNSEQGELCEKNLKNVIKHRTERVKNRNDSKACAIQAFIHEVKGEKLKAEEFYAKALTKGLDFGESCLLTEMRIWLMRFSETEKSVVNLIFDGGSYDEVGSGRLKIFKGSMNKKIVNLVDIDVYNAKRILRWEKLTPGPHAILLEFFLHDGQFTDQTKQILENLEFLGEKLWNHVIVVFTEGNCSIKYTGAQRSVLEWIREKCRHKTYICGNEPETTERRELSERIQRMILGNNSMHLVLPEISDGDSQSPSDIKLEVKDYSFTPEVIFQEGQSKYRLQSNCAGWFLCEFTKLGFNMKGEGDVLYSTVLQDSDCPVLANYYQAGPLYDIKCVQGELSQLCLPHCEISIEDGSHLMSVMHYSNQIVDILKPQNITSTHVTVSIPGTSKFSLFKPFGHRSKIHGQVMLFYKKNSHRLHVFLQPRNVDPREVIKCDKDYTQIQLPCDCMLKYDCEYSISCDPVEEYEPPERPVSKIQPLEAKFCCTKQWTHFYPTFEIMLLNGVMNVRLRLKKKGEVENPEWDRYIDLADYTAGSTDAEGAAAENSGLHLSDKQRVSFLKDNQHTLTERVTNVNAILDGLYDVIADELLSEIRKMTTYQKQMRRIFEITGKQGFSSQLKFVNLLYKAEKYLIEDIINNTNVR